MISLHKQRFWKGLLFGLSGLMLCGCLEHIRLSSQQLHGADPSQDLVAGPVLHKLKRAPSPTMSVYGVRLLDSLQRATKLWGKPNRVTKRHYFWNSAKGRPRFRVLVGKQTYVLKKSSQVRSRVVIRQIDIFSTYRSQLHPANRDLLDPKRIESDSWRQKVFGSSGAMIQRSLDTRFVYPKWGYQLLLLSKLLPLQRKVNAIFTLYLSRQSMTRYRVTRIP